MERRQRRTIVLVIVLTQLVVAVLTGAVISVAYGKLDRNFKTGDEIEHQTKKKHLIGGDPLNILVMGSDSRAGAGNDIDGQTDIGQRSDTTILVHVSADRKTVYGVSLPRDAMVARPECKSSDGEAPAAVAATSQSGLPGVASGRQRLQARKPAACAYAALGWKVTLADAGVRAGHEGRQ